MLAYFVSDSCTEPCLCADSDILVENRVVTEKEESNAYVIN